jgi:hypothetical protein
MTTPTDDALLGRAVRNARDTQVRKGVKHPRWVAVMCAFCLGSTMAKELVQRYGMDPDELVAR